MKAANRWKKWVGFLGATGLCGAGLIYGHRMLEQRIVRSALGPGSTFVDASIFPRSNSGRLDYVEIPLAVSTSDSQHRGELRAYKLWFNYDFASLLRKKFIFPKVVLEGVELDLPAPAPYRSQLTDSPAWIGGLNRIIVELQGQEFLQKTAVMEDLASTESRWEESFSKIYAVVRSTQSQFETLQRRLLSLDNQLRSAETMRAASGELGGLIVDVGNQLKEVRTSKEFQDIDRRGIRASLASSVTTLEEQGKAFSSPDPAEVAKLLVNESIARLWHQYRPHLDHVSVMLDRPFEDSNSERGQDIEHGLTKLPSFAITEAKLSGKATLGKSKQPFSAVASYRSAFKQNDADQPQTSSYRLTLGNPLEPLTIDAEHTLSERSGEQLRFEVDDVKCCSMDLVVKDGKLEGSIAVQLADWIAGEGNIFQSLNSSTAMARDIVEKALAQNPEIPKRITVPVSGTLESPKFELCEEAYTWLSEAMATVSDSLVRDQYAVLRKQLDEEVNNRLNKLDLHIATSRREAEAQIQRLNGEMFKLLKKIELEIDHSNEINIVRMPKSANQR